MPETTLMDLVRSLASYPDETEWIEFKEGSRDAERIGRDISALANAAAYAGRDFAYKVWGVEDGAHALVGTSFRPLHEKAKGNQDLQIWLRSALSQNASYEFLETDLGERHFVVLKIAAASGMPVRFRDVAYIRIGSSTTKLVAGSAREAELWRRLQGSRFETLAALENVRRDAIPELLNVDAYYELCHIPRPSTFDAVLLDLVEQDIVRPQDDGAYAITNLGALLLAKRLTAFRGLRKRVIRVVRFLGNGNFEIVGDKLFDEGYATALPRAEEHIMAITPASEVVDGAFRRVRHAFPQRAVRELLSNMVIHQDLSCATAGPMVSIYDNRIAFSNPGGSLIARERLLNAQPKTRNDLLASQLRLMGLCEEGGTGWDLAVAACEAEHMLPPRMETDDETGTTVTLFLGNAYERMSRNERCDALYWHACLRYAQGGSMSNATARERFGLGDERRDSLAISRLIRTCCEAGLIREEDETAGSKYRRYIPAWA